MVAHTPVCADAAVIALVGMAHASAHLFHLLLPLLFVRLMAEFGFGYTEPGFPVSVYRRRLMVVSALRRSAQDYGRLD